MSDSGAPGLHDFWADEIEPRARKAAAMMMERAQNGAFSVTFAESCTGGMLSAALTSVPGVSAVYNGGFTTYSNEAKMKFLGVARETLEAHGAVSGECAREMAAGARTAMGADVAISVTGIAGPDGGSKEKPVGTVWFGVATQDGKSAAKRLRFGDLPRGEIRLLSVREALDILLLILEGGEID